MEQENKMLTEAVEKAMSDEKAPEIKHDYRKFVTESVLKNQIGFMKGLNESDAPTNQTSGVSNWDPVLIRMVRRSMPQLMAFDLAGVQPMTGPTGSIFAMRSRYSNQTGDEALHNEANSAFSGDQSGAQTGDTSGFEAGYFDDTEGSEVPAESTAPGEAMTKAAGEVLGSQGENAWREMAFTVERADVSAKSRKLKAQFSRELQYDLRNIHGLDADSELANILSTEITAEIDRELLRTINKAAVVGAQGAATPGRFDLTSDSDGRWMVERFKGLLFQLEIEANAVSKATRRGRANRVVCSSNVASAMNMAGVLEYNPNLAANLQIDDSSQTYAGVLLGKFQVFIDPYATIDYITVGYRGGNAWDAGVYYCPYLPLEMYRSQGEDNFNPKIGFATRYGLVANPFAATNVGGGSKPGAGLGFGENPYFRKFAVQGIGVA